MSVKKNIGTHGYSFRKPMWKWSKDMQKEQNVRLVLASASPRRRELLSQIGLEFTVMPSTKEENAKTTEAGALVQELSRQKAVDIWEQLSGGQGQNPDADQEQIAEETQEPNLNGKRQPELLVIGADTVVCCEGKILGKPHSREAAAEMLTALQGRSHEVYTGVTLYSQSETVTFFECTQVEFYPMTEVEISEYIDSKEPMDKAGAYGIQGLGARFVKGIRGDYNNVVGLPVGRLYQELKSHGWM